MVRLVMLHKQSSTLARLSMIHIAKFIYRVPQWSHWGCSMYIVQSSTVVRLKVLYLQSSTVFRLKVQYLQSSTLAGLKVLHEQSSALVKFASIIRSSTLSIN